MNREKLENITNYDVGKQRSRDSMARQIPYLKALKVKCSKSAFKQQYVECNNE